MIDEGSFWDYEGDSEYKSNYGDYHVISRTVEVDQIIQSMRSSFELYKDGKHIADVKNSDLEVMRGIESVFHRRHRETGDFSENVINLEKGIICRVIEPTHGRIATKSGDRRLICGNENDVKMTKDDWESEKRSRWY